MRRYALRDDQWERIKDFLPGREGHVGGTAVKTSPQHQSTRSPGRPIFSGAMGRGR